jgi:hypothetical protein
MSAFPLISSALPPKAGVIEGFDFRLGMTLNGHLTSASREFVKRLIEWLRLARSPLSRFRRCDRVGSMLQVS